jgi:hypothetical protein
VLKVMLVFVAVAIWSAAFFAVVGIVLAHRCAEARVLSKPKTKTRDASRGL